MVRIQFMKPEENVLLTEGAKAFGIHLDEEAVHRFSIYLDELLKWNRKINLTAIRTEREIIIKHFLDSLSVYPYLFQHHILLDIGSGAGFPGIPLKIVGPGFNIALVDSVLKKVDFQNHIIRTLRLDGIKAVHGRLEPRRVPEELAGRFDAVVARALSDLKTFLSIAYLCLRAGGTAVAMKGKGNEEELRAAIEAEASRYSLSNSVTFSLPFTRIERSILFFEKRH
jgi:16S rRNA (guanine527-N7)-methyltransferase